VPAATAEGEGVVIEDTGDALAFLFVFSDSSD
jgi:hypothetical protein